VALRKNEKKNNRDYSDLCSYWYYRSSTRSVAIINAEIDMNG